MIHKNRKKWVLLGICSLLLCLLCGCESNEQRSGRYIVRRINSTAQTDDYFLRDHGVLRKYSVSEQKEVCEIGNGDSIECYAVDEDYIFWGYDVSSDSCYITEVWKMNNKTGESELFLKKDLNIGISWLALSNGYLLYGAYGPNNDVYFCPIDGNPETDIVSLDKQITEPTKLGWNFDETIYRGWRIIREGSEIHSIIELESGKMIYTSTNPGDKILWTGEELIHFLNGNFVYYRLNEEKVCSIQCLDKQEYKYAYIDGNHLMVENGKIIGLLVVANKWMRTDWYYDLPQNDIKNDVLFEIDLETDTSKVIYSTKNADTRIVGYRDGTVYLFQDDMIYSENLKGKDRKELLDLYEKGLYSSTLYFDWHGNNLIIYNERKTRIGSVEVAD